jgi:hypothetical protein
MYDGHAVRGLIGGLCGSFTFFLLLLFLWMRRLCDEIVNLASALYRTRLVQLVHYTSTFVACVNPAILVEHCDAGGQLLCSTVSRVKKGYSKAVRSQGGNSASCTSPTAKPEASSRVSPRFPTAVESEAQDDGEESWLLPFLALEWHEFKVGQERGVVGDALVM